jgi:hypothetical protein
MYSKVEGEQVVSINLTAKAYEISRSDKRHIVWIDHKQMHIRNVKYRFHVKKIKSRSPGRILQV